MITWDITFDQGMWKWGRSVGQKLFFLQKTISLPGRCRYGFLNFSSLCNTSFLVQSFSNHLGHHVWPSNVKRRSLSGSQNFFLQKTISIPGQCRYGFYIICHFLVHLFQSNPSMITLDILFDQVMWKGGRSVGHKTFFFKKPYLYQAGVDMVFSKFSSLLSTFISSILQWSQGTGRSVDQKKNSLKNPIYTRPV